MRVAVLDTHLRRRAVVYLRQSTLKQVMEHTESTRRQYLLRERAQALGWRPDAIEVVDEDLGRSGASAQGRSGFQRVSEEVARGEVGALFALDVSRLARSSADWHRLLDLCGLADVLIADEQALYHPGDYNDRLLLGIKGTMSEAELSWMQLRLRGARASKARRGEFRLPPPVGYWWDKALSRLRLDPDEEVGRAVHLVFERFPIERSAYGVARYFIEHDLQLPARDAKTHQLRWSPPRPSRLLQMLTNPTYAGAYVYGRREHTVKLAEGQVVRRCRRLPADSWKVVHRERHPAYLTWEEYVKNQQILHDNRPSRDAPERHGAARKGEALLQGLVLCGKCGHRMHSAYSGRSPRARYICASPVQAGKSMHLCWSVGASAIDRAVGERVLAAVQPEGIELGLTVVREAQRQTDEVAHQWRLRLERARYEVTLAERRYKAVDPDNRTVARTLEREWEEKLEELQDAERRYTEAREKKQVALTAREQERIAALAQDLPRLWASPSTTMAERKNITRTVIQELCLTPVEGPSRGTRVAILWRTGATTGAWVERQLPGRRTSTEAGRFIEQHVKLGMPAPEIAMRLNKGGLMTATGALWTNLTVHAYCRARQLRWPHRMPSSVRKADRREDGLYSLRGVAKQFGVTENAVHYWVQQGWLRRTEGERRGRCGWYRLDAETRHHLQRVRDAHTRTRSLRKLQSH
ncbi:recombinase family protein [Myxococcus sp. CA056]|uniref:recombinase family protein n=1 Tax=unclassified Myxococcus TaxID=2648731 RepID=UPI00157A75E1|nr:MULTISPECIES: recombinase family protein [unclassified Myxococcus]NTX17864.1 recombinase family protein [Myxococcus sp. CA056]NTX58698.1 recombinase family protein [Myxococcus sp. CA039A]